MRLARGEVHIWLGRLDGGAEERLPDALALLSEAELARADRFLVPRPRVEYILSHALVRTALAECSGADPRDFDFRVRPHGKPEIAAPAGLEALRFNLSHTRGLCACAVVRGSEVGVDVEHKRGPVSLLDVARTVFSPAEMEAFDLAPAEDRREIFYARWTLKEALMKATGEGFRLSPERLHFPLIPGQKEAVEVAQLDGEDLLSKWQFHRFYPTPDHAGALAVERGAEGPLAVVFHSPPEV